MVVRVHISKNERSKLDDRAKQCIFLGHEHEEFGYRLWNPMDKKVIRSKDVVFFEGQTIEDIGKDEQPEKIASNLIDLELIPTPTAHNDNEEDVHPPHE